jgi:hypothetical protein
VDRFERYQSADELLAALRGVRVDFS